MRRFKRRRLNQDVPPEPYPSGSENDLRLPGTIQGHLAECNEDEQKTEQLRERDVRRKPRRSVTDSVMAPSEDDKENNRMPPKVHSRAPEDDTSLPVSSQLTTHTHQRKTEKRTNLVDYRTQQERELRRYKLSGVRETDRELMCGRFYRAIEVEYKGVTYAAKYVYKDEGRESLHTKFVDECLLCSKLSHPNILEFVGVYYRPTDAVRSTMSSPVLVTELLLDLLAQYLKENGILPIATNYSILQDVARGLQYLHDLPQPVVHGNLTAYSVLLTKDFRAKICGFREARILTPGALQVTTSRYPRNPNYTHIPPEAFTDVSYRGIEIDTFSYGDLALHVCTGEQPNNLLPRVKQHLNELVARSEIERRQHYLTEMGPNHPLRSLIIDCLSNEPADRPTDTQILHRLQEITSSHQNSKRLFAEAMKHGYVEAGLIVLLLIGAAGAGKTHAKNLFLGLPPPELRQSTPLVEEAIRLIFTQQAMVSGTSYIVWNPVTLKKLKKMIADAVKALAAQAEESQGHTVPSLDSLNEPSPQTQPKAVSGVTEQHDGPSAPEPVSHGNAPEPLEPPSQESLSQDSPPRDVLEEELVDLVRSSTGSRKLFDVDWVHLVDSGGQPTFQEILPLFLHNASAIAFVMKLNERLDDKPKVEWYGEDGEQCGSSYSSPLTNEEILRHSIRGMRSRQSLAPEESGPQILVVGTHKDREGTCSESREEKNSKLLNMLRPHFSDNLAYYNIAGTDEVIFPVNAKEPTEEDRKVAELFRRMVVSKGRTQPRVKIPLPWYVFEQYIRQLAAKVSRKVLCTSECEKEAEKLHMSSEACKEALVYLDKISMFFYRPDYLEGLLFCSAQVFLDKISELVELIHRLKGKAEASNRRHVPDFSEFCNSEGIKFRDHGIVTVDILKKFPKHYVEGLFSPTDLLKLLTAFLVTAPLSDGSHDEYIMPCLLQRLSPEELDSHRQLHPSPAAPLVIQFPDNWVPAGVFIVLTVYLQNLPDWKLCLSTSGNHPRCLHRNCVEFRLPARHGGFVTLIDSFEYLEVHIHDASNKACQKACPGIVADIQCGVKEAARRLHYGTLQLETAFLCPTPSSACRLDHHPANVTDDELVCSVSGRKTGDVQDQHKIWLLSEDVQNSLHALDNVPRIYQFQYLSNKSRKMEIKIIKEIQSIWREVSDHLHLPSPTVRNLEEIPNQRACRTVFEKWLDGEGREPKNWHTVIEVLIEMNQKTLADKISLILED